MISIVVPVYKSEKTLERCLESIINQTCRDIEIILVVDGSPDFSYDIAKSYEKKDNRIAVISKDNEGVSKARNVGIAAAGGEFIQFVDSDDYIEPDTCELLLKAMEEEEADMVICGYHHHYLGRDIVKISNISGTFSNSEAPDKFLRLYMTGYLNMPWNKLYKKEYITGYFQEQLNLGEDLLFNLAYMKNCRNITVLNKALCHYIQERNKDTLSTKFRDNKLVIAETVYKAVMNYYKEMYHKEDESGIIKSRFIMEFLDDIESLAFRPAMKTADKIDTIREYGKIKLLDKKEKIRLHLLDYKIIYFFMRRGHYFIVYFLIYLRKAIVILSKKN